MNFLKITLLFILITADLMANTIKHNISKGVLHKGGSIEIQKEEKDNKLIATFRYKLKKKWGVMVPGKVLNGNKDVELPMAFSTEQGYIDLKKNKKLELEKVIVEFVGMIDVNGYQDCYEIKISRKKNDWYGYLYYHPSVTSMGWVKSRLFFDVPIMKGHYSMSSYLE